MICKCLDKRKDGKSSFRNLCEYIAGINNEEEKVLFTRCQNFALFDDTIPDDFNKLIVELDRVAKHNHFVKDPVFHAILSWSEGEIPTEEQVAEAVNIFLEEQGLEECQCVYALHKNTDILHAHICVNRVQPFGEWKAIQAGDGKGFWKKASERAARKIELTQGWKRTNGKFYEVIEDNKIVEIKTDKVAFDKSISYKAKDFENLTGAKSGERIAREKLAPILFNAESWQKLHTQLAENGARLQKKGAGLVLFVGEVPVKLSSISQQLSLKKLEKRLGNFEVANETTPPVKEIKEEPLIKQMPSIDEYLKKRKEYYETKHKAFDDLRQQYSIEWNELREKQKKERQEDYKSRSSWKGHGAELNYLRTQRAVCQLEEKELFKKLKKKQREELKKIFTSRFPSYKQWLIDGGKEQEAMTWRYREILNGAIFGDRDTPLYNNPVYGKFNVRQEQWDGKLASVFRNKADKVIFVDRGKRISIERYDNKGELTYALKLAQQKWGSIKINGNEKYISSCIDIAILNNIKIANPELQERIARRKAELDCEREKILEEQKEIKPNAKDMIEKFEAYSKALGADGYRVTVAKRIQEGEEKGQVDNKHTWLLKNQLGSKELTALEVKDRCHYINNKLLKEKNDIYLTPISNKYHYILVDDVSLDKLKQMQDDGYRPAIGIETSPRNYQLILKVPKLPDITETTEKTIANKLMRELNQKYGDPKISSAVHPHRMPRTYNFKPKYLEEYKQHPHVGLRYTKDIVCSKSEERLKQLLEIQKTEDKELAERRNSKLKHWEKGSYNVLDDKLTPYDAYMCHARDIYQHYMGRIKDERGNVNMSVIDSMVAERMVVTGYSESEIARGVASGSRAFRPDSEKDKHNWEEYGARTARYAFSIAGQKNVRALESKKRFFTRYIEGRKPYEERVAENNRRIEEQKQRKRVEERLKKR